MQCHGVVVLVALVAAVTAQEYYSGRWNDVDTHQIIDNTRLSNKYADCITKADTTGCPQDSLELRNVLPEALETVCAKCSPEQQVKIKDTLEYFCKKQPKSFEKILRKIDSENKFRPLFEAKFGVIGGGC